MPINPTHSSNYNYYSNNNQNSSKKTSYHKTRPNTDTYEFSHKPPQKKNKHVLPKKLTVILASMAIGAGGHAVATRDKIPSPVVIHYNAAETPIENVADIYDTDETAILAFNDIQDEDELYSKENLIIPYSYDTLDEKIENIQKKLYNSDLTLEQREELTDKYKELAHTKFVRENIAETYTDGKFMYYVIKPVTEDTTYDAAKLYSFDSINVEDFKQVFNIKDKAIRKYNNIHFTYEKDSYETSGGYKDYTGAYLKAGETIKVPLSAIKD